MADWAAGDLAMCIGNPCGSCCAPKIYWSPEVGGIYTVSAVDIWPNSPCDGLSFTDDPNRPNRWTWISSQFVKIRPGQKFEEPRRQLAPEKVYG